MIDKIIDEFIVSAMQDDISQYLRHTPQDSLRNVAVEMVSQGYNIFFVSRVTGISVNEINKLQNSKIKNLC
jgi:putative NIF3 family GTP cyclohydrolase 1 type 2